MSYFSFVGGGRGRLLKIFQFCFFFHSNLKPKIVQDTTVGDASMRLYSYSVTLRKETPIANRDTFNQQVPNM